MDEALSRGLGAFLLTPLCLIGVLASGLSLYFAIILGIVVFIYVMAGLRLQHAVAVTGFFLVYGAAAHFDIAPKLPKLIEIARTLQTAAL